MSRTEAPPASVENRRPASRRWLIPLLWIAIPALAAVVSWAWQHRLAPRPLPPRALPPLVLTGNARRDRQAILERAADLVFPPNTSAGNLTLAEIGVELLPLDPARGTEVVRRSIQAAQMMASTQMVLGALQESAPPPLTLGSVIPDRTPIGMLVHLARSLGHYPQLAASALEAAYHEARGNQDAEERIYALSIFALVAADIDPARARSALQQAKAGAAALPRTAPADPLAAVAAAVARVEGTEAARPLVDRALASIPSGAARPLVEARLAAELVNAAPARARMLARQALADVGKGGGRSEAQLSGPSRRPEAAADHPQPRAPEQKYFGRSLSELRATAHRKPRPPQPRKPRPRPVSLALRQSWDVAMTLAASHPEVALAAVQRISPPAARAQTFINMAFACDTGAPARAEAYFRRALRAAEALPPGRERRATIIGSATGLAAYDLRAARGALSLAPGPVPAINLMMLGARAAKREPVAARQLIEEVREANPPLSPPVMAPLPPGLPPATAGTPASSSEAYGILDYDEISLAEVTTEPDLGHALALAQQAPYVEAPALLIVARRLKQHGER